MKHNKHIHDEDYDINIKLMVPLLSILVCTVCLCATTWAWYTASVSTGVASITAKANVTETVKDANGNRVDIQNGKYILRPGENNENKTYTIEFTLGDASNGYFALIDIEDGDARLSSNSISLLDLFVNRVYAEGDETKKCVAISKDETTSIYIVVNTTKTISIHYAWAVYKDNKPDLGDGSNSYGEPVSGTIDLREQTQTPKTATITFNYIDATTGKPLPYSVLGIESYGLRENEEDLPQTATIVYEADGEEIEIFAPEGYLLEKNDSFNEKENVESRVYRIETDEDVVINVSCVPIPQDTSNDIETENTSESDNDVTEITPPNIDNSSDETETPNTDSSDATEQKNSSEISNADETDQSNTNTEQSGDQPVESLLITNSTDEGTAENAPSSDDINSGTE